MKQLFLLFSALCITLALSNCSDDDAASTPPAETRTYYYMYNVANGEDELSVVLDSLNSPIANIANPAAWLSVEQTGTQDGHPVIRIKAQESQPNVQKEAQLILMAEDGNMVELTVCQGFNFVPDSTPTTSS